MSQHVCNKHISSTITILVSNSFPSSSPTAIVYRTQYMYVIYSAGIKKHNLYARNMKNKLPAISLNDFFLHVFFIVIDHWVNLGIF